LVDQLDKDVNTFSMRIRFDLILHKIFIWL
jgi:hypothetical protein